MTPSSAFFSDPFARTSALTWLFLYRLVLASVVVLIFYDPAATPPLDRMTISPLRLVLGVHAALILISGLLIPAGWPSRERQIELAVFIDICAYTLVMHIGGGISTGLGVLPAIAVVAGAILMEGRLSLMFASVATLALLAEQVVSDMQGTAGSAGYLQVGLLGLTYFAVALLAHVLTARLRETEQLAAKRKVDIADLSKLNHYVIQSMSTGVVVIDGERKMMLMNQAAKHLLGAPRARPGDSLFRIAPELRDWFQRELRQDSPADPVVSLVNGEVRPTLHLLGEGRDTGALIYLHDNQQLLRQAQDMKLASLGRLTASIAHNIRNPLSSVTHATQLLAESDALAAEDRHLLQIIRRNALRIDETVTSVLALSRRHQADLQEIDLSQWLREFCAEYRENHPEIGSRLQLAALEPQIMVHVDPRHLTQILRNLCENAFKHGLRGGEPPLVEIAAGRDPDTQVIAVTVTDDGPGIPPSQQRGIFEPFFTTSSSGTGLGLYAARESAEANAMRLEYIGGRSVGARFKLTFGNRESGASFGNDSGTSPYRR